MVLCREKIDTLIKFPLEGLNLSPHIRGGGISCAESEQERSAEPIYDLYAGHRCFYDLKNHHDISNPNSSLILTPNLILTRIPTITSQKSQPIVSNHYGGSGFGHYTAYCLAPGSQDWNLFDDSTVSKVVLARAFVYMPCAYPCHLGVLVLSQCGTVRGLCYHGQGLATVTNAGVIC